MTFLAINKFIILNNNITRYSNIKNSNTNSNNINNNKAENKNNHINGTSIDHIYFRNNNYKNKKKLAITNGTITVDIADHMAIYITINFSENKPKIKENQKEERDNKEYFLDYNKKNNIINFTEEIKYDIKNYNKNEEIKQKYSGDLFDNIIKMKNKHFLINERGKSNPTNKNLPKKSYQ